MVCLYMTYVCDMCIHDVCVCMNGIYDLGVWVCVVWGCDMSVEETSAFTWWALSSAHALSLDCILLLIWIKAVSLDTSH